MNAKIWAFCTIGLVSVGIGYKIRVNWGSLRKMGAEAVYKQRPSAYMDMIAPSVYPATGLSAIGSIGCPSSRLGPGSTASGAIAIGSPASIKGASGTI